MEILELKELFSISRSLIPTLQDGSVELLNPADTAKARAELLAPSVGICIGLTIFRRLLTHHTSNEKHLVRFMFDFAPNMNLHRRLRHAWPYTAEEARGTSR